MGVTVIGFPFDLFGSPGSGEGVELLMDELREILADNRDERVPTRARIYQDTVKLRELRFDSIASYGKWRSKGRQAARKAWLEGDFLIWLSGNHLGALPIYDELAGSRQTMVVQLDAHLDIHHFSGCKTELTNGNFLMHCAGKLPPIRNLGHRDLLLPDDHIDKYYRAAVSAERLCADEKKQLRQLRKDCTGAERVVLDLDCDVFDPMQFPAVAHPVPFGLSSEMFLKVLDTICSESLVGVVISEFHPAHDQHDRSLALLAWLIEFLFIKHGEFGKRSAPALERRRLR